MWGKIHTNKKKIVSYGGPLYGANPLDKMRTYFG